MKALYPNPIAKLYLQEWCKYPEALAEKAMQGVAMHGLVLCETCIDAVTGEVTRRILKWEELEEVTE